MCRAVVFNDHWIIHGNVGSALIEVAHWIASRLHHVHNQTVGDGNCSFGIVDEPALNFIPSVAKAGFVGRRQGADFELLSSLLAKLQYPFTLAYIPFPPDHPVVLRPKAFA